MPEYTSPFKFANGIQVKNRAVLAPMTNSQSHEDGTLSAAELHWLEMRAEGDFGTIISAASHVQPTARAWAGQLGCFSDAHLPGLKKLGELGRKHGAATILQLFHGGVRCPKSLTGVPPTAPSVVTLDFPGFEEPRALEEAEIENILSNFVAAGQRAHAAGLSGIEVHGANGYLFTQFLSTVTNRRTDRWGGSLVNRARLLVECVRRLKAELPENFIVGVRILPEDAPTQRGFDVDDAVQVARWLAELGLHYVHISAGDTNAVSWKYPDSKELNLGRFRAALPKEVALLACGGVKQAGDADNALRSGADLVAIGKVAISTPDWPRAAQRAEFAPPPFPITPERAAAAGVSPTFVTVLGHYGLVKAGAPANAPK